MKYPKLQQSTLCMLLIYSPPVLLFFGGFFLMFIAENFGKFDFIFGIAGFVCLISSLIYLLKNFVFLMTSDLLFQAISSWKRDRTVFISTRNGSEKASIAKNICVRTKRYGKSISAADSTLDLNCFVHRHRRSCTVFYSSIERYAMMVSARHLDAEAFDDILQASKAELLCHFSDAENRWPKRVDNSAEQMFAAAVIILADSISDDIPLLARNEVSISKGCLLPCVIDCSSAKYYFNSMKNPYFLGGTVKPEKNYAVEMMTKLVFAGRLPKDHPENRPEITQSSDENNLFELDESLWSYIKKYKGSIHDYEKELEKEGSDAFVQISDGEVRLGKHSIYCKLGGQMTTLYYFTPDDEDGKVLDIEPPKQWSLPKKKPMAERDISDVCSLVEKVLAAQGYECIFAVDDKDSHR